MPEATSPPNPSREPSVEAARKELNAISRQFKVAAIAALAVIGIGVLFYRIVENMEWVNAFYFSVVSLTTVGYGDIVPITDTGKIFTACYILIGIGLIAAFATTLGKRVMAQNRYRHALHHENARVPELVDEIENKL